MKKCRHIVRWEFLEQNKDELQVVMFPDFKITFDELFDIE